MGLSNDLSCEAGSLSCCRPNPHGVFNQRFEALFPGAVALGCAVCFAPRRRSSGLSMFECGAAMCYPHSACPVLRHSESGPLSLSARMWGRRVCQWSDCLPRSSHTLPVSVPPWQRESSPPRLPISAPPTGLDECLFFYFLGVGLPCRSIFCQFWLCEEAQCVYICLHLRSVRYVSFPLCLFSET